MFTITDLSAQDIWNLEQSIPAVTALHVSPGHDNTHMHALHACALHSFIDNRDNGSNVVKVLD